MHRNTNNMHTCTDHSQHGAGTMRSWIHKQEKQNNQTIAIFNKPRTDCNERTEILRAISLDVFFHWKFMIGPIDLTILYLVPRTCALVAMAIVPLFYPGMVII